LRVVRFLFLFFPLRVDGGRSERRRGLLIPLLTLRQTCCKLWVSQCRMRSVPPPFLFSFSSSYLVLLLFPITSQWIARRAIPTARFPTATCTTQAVFIQMGDLGSAFSSVLICVNLFRASFLSFPFLPFYSLSDAPPSPMLLSSLHRCDVTPPITQSHPRLPKTHDRQNPRLRNARTMGHHRFDDFHRTDGFRKGGDTVLCVFSVFFSTTRKRN
jgi:hypothetical protein